MSVDTTLCPMLSLQMSCSARDHIMTVSRVSFVHNFRKHSGRELDSCQTHAEAGGGIEGDEVVLAVTAHSDSF